MLRQSPRYGHPPCGQLLQVTVTPCTTLPLSEQLAPHGAPAHSQVMGPAPPLELLHMATSVPPRSWPSALGVSESACSERAFAGG